MFFTKHSTLSSLLMYGFMALWRWLWQRYRRLFRPNQGLQHRKCMVKPSATGGMPGGNGHCSFQPISTLS